ncbi:MAG: hypothetical protein NTW87_36740, partial [Planctomycetota bacterium]|nr:hypothetical protein [Planctomycetota bacterium]
MIRPSAPFAEVGQGATGLTEDSFPRTFHNGGDEFLFVRNAKVSETAYHVITKRVADDGTDRDQNPRIIDSASQGVLNGAAAAAVGSQYLVVWMDGRRSGSQPSRQLNVYGWLLDGTQPGDDVPPFLKAVARATPLVGNSPLTVYFGTGGSTGQADAILWEFGDGASSTYGSTNHVYGSKGIYVAVLSLFRAGYTMRDFVRVFVDMDETGGGGGPPQAIGGSLGPVSNGVNTDVILNSLTVTLNFAKPGTDSLRVSGYMDPGVLPVLVTDKTGSLSFGSKTYSFTTDANGLFLSTAGELPVVHFVVNRYNGAFVLTAASDDL